MPEFSGTLIRLFNAKREAPDQGGLLSGQDPTAVNTSDPLRLWIIQLGIIVATASLLSLVLRRLRQPKVIAEVLGGILLGPTAFGRIPGFTEHIFPDASRPYLSLTANIGLCLFLFLVGLEIDATVIRKNARLSVTVALAGMVLPFGIGAGLSVALYREFISESIKFTYFMLFAGVAFSITAFPVLCRILTELKLLDTTVGIVVLSAGVGNDIIGWTLLALSVALVNAGSGVTAVYILLCCVGWTLFLLFGVKYALLWLARKTGSSAFVTGLIVPREGNLSIALTEKLEDMVAIIFLPLYFTLSGLSTDLGLLNNGEYFEPFIILVERTDPTSAGITWAYTIAIICTAFLGKFGGCTLAAHFVAGFTWRESGAIGSLMSCKGLVELIVLNVGLSAGILTPRVFSMFVLEALTLTFMTTPLVTRFYPPHLRRRVSAVGGTFGSVAGAGVDGEAAYGADAKPRASEAYPGAGAGAGGKRRFTVVLDKLEHLPGAMAMAQLVQPPWRASAASAASASTSVPGSEDSPDTASTHVPGPAPSTTPASPSTPASTPTPAPVSVSALRLIELSDRTSAVMWSAAADTLLRTDPLLAVFRMFGALNALCVAPALAVVPYDDLWGCVVEHAGVFGAEMVVLCWMPPSVVGPDAGENKMLMMPPTPTPKAAPSHNPFDILFKTSGGSGFATPTPDNKPSTLVHSQFVRGVFANARCDVAVFVDCQSGAAGAAGAGIEGMGVIGANANGTQHLFLPFFGGPDDRLALEFVVQVCESERVSATVVRMVKREHADEPALAGVPPAYISRLTHEEANAITVASAVTSGFPDTVYGQPNTATRMQSDTADNITWARYASPTAETASSPTLGPALSRIEFKELGTPTLLRTGIHEALDARARAPGARLLVVAGRGRRMAVESHKRELREVMAEYGS
ncbi:hypothetical protein H0H92_011484, partial [Tricholoma furcatifolium]